MSTLSVAFLVTAKDVVEMVGQRSTVRDVEAE